MTNYNERLDEIAVDLWVKYGKLGTMDDFVSEAKQQLLALIEQREREARIDELNNLAQSEVMFFNNDYAQAKLIHDHIEALQKGKL